MAAFENEHGRQPVREEKELIRDKFVALKLTTAQVYGRLYSILSNIDIPDILFTLCAYLSGICCQG